MNSGFLLGFTYPFLRLLGLASFSLREGKEGFLSRHTMDTLSLVVTVEAYIK